MRFPALAECLESAPTIVRCQLHREDIAQLAIEVGTLRLGPLDHADCDVPQRLKPARDNPQRHRFAGARLTRDQGEAPLLDQLFDTPGEVLDPGSRQQCFAGELGRKRVPLQPLQCE